MARVPFSDQPDDARLWIFAARDDLSPDAVEALAGSVDEFLEGWAAHGHPLRASRDISDGRFLFVTVDRASEPPSGCSIDAMVRHLKSLEGRVGTPLVAHGPVWFRDADSTIRCVTRQEFKQLARDGEVDLETPVFDTTITELEALRDDRFEVAARDAWHGTAFFG